MCTRVHARTRPHAHTHTTAHTGPFFHEFFGVEHYVKSSDQRAMKGGGNGESKLTLVSPQHNLHSKRGSPKALHPVYQQSGPSRPRGLGTET